jgi:dihydrofolate reductase
VRRVIVSEFVSLDGVMEAPERWTLQFASEEQQRYKFDELAAADALLLGRTTYQGFAAAWPGMMDQYEGPHRAELGQYADMMNGYPKHVASTTLQEPLEWNNSTLIGANVVEGVSNLRRQEGKEILLFGSAELVNTLMGQDLVDEYRLMIFPVVLGSGKRLFGDGSATTKSLRLADSWTFASGVVVLTYEPAGNEAQGQTQ